MKVFALLTVLPLLAAAARCGPARISESESPSSTEPVQSKTTVPAIPTSSAEPTPTATEKQDSEAPESTPTTTPDSFPVDHNPPDPEAPYTGEGTFYPPGLGSCGFTDKLDAPVVAVSHLLFDSWPGATLDNPNKNPICNRSLKVSWGGKTQYARVRDRCQSCAMRDLDMSPSLFYALTGKLGYGRLGDPDINDSPPVTWEWVTGEVPLTPLPKAEGGETYGLIYD